MTWSRWYHATTMTRLDSTYEGLKPFSGATSRQSRPGFGQYL